MAHHVGSVHEGAFRALDPDGLSNLQASHVLADVARRVRLDEEVKVARLVITADGSVRPHNLLCASVGLFYRSSDRDVLTDWQAED